MNFLSLLAAILTFTQASPLTLQEAVKQTLENSPKLRAARFEAKAAQAQTDNERPIVFPSLKMEAVANLQGPHKEFPANLGVPDPLVDDKYGKVSLIFEQTLYRPGKSAANDRYSALTRVNNLEEIRTRNDVILDVRRAFITLLSTQTMTSLARRGVDMAKKQRDQVKLMLEARNVPERDLLASEADVADAEQGLLKAENGIVLARANLNRLMGRNPSNPLEIISETPPPPPDDPEPGIQAAFRNRPEVLIIEENIRAAQAGFHLAKTQSQPYVNFRATASAQSPTALMDNRYYAAGFVLKWDILDSHKSLNDQKAAQARVKQLEALLEDAKLGIRVEIEKAWHDMREANARIETVEKQITSAESALSVSELRYQAGKTTLLEVEGARYNLLKASANHAQAVYDLSIAWADYTHAIGSDVPDVKPKR